MILLTKKWITHSLSGSMAFKLDSDILKNDGLANKAFDHHADLEKANSERGMLGRLWGGASSVPNNIAALVTIILLLTGVLYTLIVLIQNIPTTLSIQSLWSIISPIITLAIGYLFGNKPNN